MSQFHLLEESKPQPKPQLVRDVERLLNGTLINPDTSCWEWQKTITNNGYGRMWLRTRMETAHRASFMLFHGAIPQGMVVMHHCHNRACINPEHLQSGTQAQNIADRDRIGHTINGERHHSNKLGVEDVINIRDLYSQREYTQTELSHMFGVSNQTINQIISYKTWKHIQ